MSEGRRRAAVYIRVSQVGTRDRGSDSYITEKVQEESARRLAADKGMDVVLVERDIDRSGRSLERAGLDRIFDAARGCEIDAVVFLYVTRVGRNLEQSLGIARQLRELGVAIYSVHEDIDQETTAGRLTFHVMASVAEAESDRLKDQWATARQRAAGRGVYLGRIPFGYAKDPVTRLVGPHPVNAAVVIDLFRRRAAGETLLDLLPTLNAASPLPDGRTHSRARVSEILMATRYRGTSENLPRLVSDAEWHAAQTPAPKVRVSVTGHDYFLTGIARCGSCGGSMAAGGTVARPVYKCSTRQTRGGVECPAGPTIMADRIEPWVLGHVGRVVKADERQVSTRAGAAAEQVAAADERRDQAEQGLAQFLADDETRALTPRAIWTAERDRRLEEIAAAQAASAAAHRALAVEAKAKPWAEVVEDPVALRLALRRRIQRLVVNPGRGKPVDERCELEILGSPGADDLDD